jgi:hypothetical protein
MFHNECSKTEAKPANGHGTDSEADQFLRSSDKKGTLQDTVSQAAWAEKKWVWVATKEEGYVAANITAENGDNVTVTMPDGKVSLASGSLFLHVPLDRLFK